MKKIVLFCSFLLAVSPYASAKSLESINFNTSNGARVVFYQAMEVPMLDIKVAFAAGSAYDKDDYGLSALTTELLNQGNDGESATVISEKLADTGAQYHATTSRDMIVLNLKTLSDPDVLNTATDVFAKIISKPDFQQSAFEREKKQQLVAIKHVLESPEEMANQTFFKVLYQDHPYAHPVLGTIETINAITREDVVSFYNTMFTRENAIIVLVGAIDKNQAKQIAEKLSGGLRQGTPPANISDATPISEAMDVQVPFPSSQTVIRLGELGITHQNKDYFPLTVGNYTLGGGSLVSQLALEVREKRGLAYGVQSQFLPLPALGPFIISLSTKTDQAETAIQVTRDTLEKFVKNGPTSKELNEAKQYLVGSFPLSLASNSNIADMLLKIAFYNLPEDFLDTYIDHINAVTTAQVKMAFQKTINPGKLLQVTVGKQ